MNLAKKLWMTTGDSSGGGLAPSGGYVDDVFSTYVYKGNGSTQNISGPNFADNAGLVWLKNRTSAGNHYLFDTVRGALNELNSNNAEASVSLAGSLTAFLNNGFSVGNSAAVNQSGQNYVGWQFRKAPKFFDVVTYTGNSGAGRQIAHSLGVAPGMVIVKAVDGAAVNWQVYHRGFTYTQRLGLNTTDAASASAGIWSAEPDAANIFVGSATGVNANAVNYVAYFFAHDPSADGIIQCGSFTGSTTVNIGWEPQWIMIKRTDAAGDWIVIDSMRGCSVGGVDAVLNPNLSNTESVSNDYIDFTATGFITKNLTGTHIYTVVRHPNKPPTSGTQVYNAIARTGTGAAATVVAGFPPDMTMYAQRTVTHGNELNDRLRGFTSNSPTLETQSTRDEFAYTDMMPTMQGVVWNSHSAVESGNPIVDWFFRRAPGFFDVVCDTGTGAAHAIAHNLTKAPELIIRKSRSAATQWEVWHSALLANEHLVLNSTAAKSTDATAWNSTLPTSTAFTVGTGANVNANAATFVTYLFATLAGISKVGSYNGNGGTQTIPCGFTTGSRFILIKRIDNTGDWFVWDTARGITPTTDPHLSLNTTVAEVTTDGSIDQDASGFVVNQNAATNINALGGNYLFLAIA